MASKQASVCSVHTCRSTAPTPVSLSVGSVTALPRRPAGQWCMFLMLCAQPRLGEAATHYRLSVTLADGAATT